MLSERPLRGERSFFGEMPLAAATLAACVTAPLVGGASERETRGDGMVAAGIGIDFGAGVELATGGVDAAE